MQYIMLFLEGIITFISPCLLPMLPVYISYFAAGETNRRKTLINSIGFVLGFTIVFLVMGAFIGSVGKLLRDYATVLPCDRTDCHDIWTEFHGRVPYRIPEQDPSENRECPEPWLFVLCPSGDCVFHQLDTMCRSISGFRLTDRLPGWLDPAGYFHVACFFHGVGDSICFQCAFNRSAERDV